MNICACARKKAGKIGDVGLGGATGKTGDPFCGDRGKQGVYRPAYRHGGKGVGRPPQSVRGGQGASVRLGAECLETGIVIAEGAGAEIATARGQGRAIPKPRKACP